MLMEKIHQKTQYEKDLKPLHWVLNGALMCLEQKSNKIWSIKEGQSDVCDGAEARACTEAEETATLIKKGVFVLLEMDDREAACNLWQLTNLAAHWLSYQCTLSDCQTPYEKKKQKRSRNPGDQ